MNHHSAVIIEFLSDVRFSIAIMFADDDNDLQDEEI